MSKVNYLEILKNAWAITWKNKYLWWFGFLLAFSGSGGMLNFRFGDFKKIEDKGINPETKQQVIDFFTANATWIIAGVSILAVICLVFLVLGIIARGGLIKSVGKISKGETADFKTGFREGKKYFWKLLAIGFIIGIFMAALMMILFIPIAFLFYGKAYILGGILSVGALAILIPIIILANFSKTYCYIYAVLGDIPFWLAIENGYLLFRKNLASSIIMSLVLMLAGIILGIAILIVLIPLVIIFLIIGGILYLFLKNIGLAIAGALGGIALLAIILFLQSIFQTFIQTSWILFFKEIASPKIPETIPEIAPEKIPSPSAAPDPITFSEE